MFLSHHIRMEHSYNRRRHKRLRDFVTFLALGSLVAGCEAKAKNEPSNPVQSTPEVTKLTVDGCAKITVQAEMVECFEKLNVQQDAEIAAKRKILETEQEVGKELDATIDMLSKEAEEAMKRLEKRVLEPER